MLSVSNVIVANILIDQLQVESILLTPNPDDAAELLMDRATYVSPLINFLILMSLKKVNISTGMMKNQVTQCTLQLRIKKITPLSFVGLHY